MFNLYAPESESPKRRRGLAKECQRRLAAQQIDLGHPGAILKDLSWGDQNRTASVVSKTGHLHMGGHGSASKGPALKEAGA
jgi:hypothetical protein